MPPKQPPQPKIHQIFDPWSSASTGHQRADGPTLSHTTAWRDLRTEKLRRQFVFGDCNADYDGRGRGEWVVMNKEETRGKEGRDIRDFMGGVQKRKRDGLSEMETGGKGKFLRGDTSNTSTHMPAPTPAPTSACTSTQNANRDISVTTAHMDTDTDTDTGIPTATATHATAAIPAPASTPASTSTTPASNKKILAGTTIYLNGSTMPLISDHKLKHLLVSHGAKLSLVFARSVTHVIIGKPNTGADKGAGGGLAAGKLQKEIDRCARGLNVVGVEWAIESIKAEKRLPETKFAIRLGKQPSVLGMLR